MISFSPEFAEWFPAIMGLIAAGLLYGLARYTSYQARSGRKDHPAE